MPDCFNPPGEWLFSCDRVVRRDTSQAKLSRLVTVSSYASKCCPRSLKHEKFGISLWLACVLCGARVCFDSQSQYLAKKRVRRDSLIRVVREKASREDKLSSDFALPVKWWVLGPRASHCTERSPECCQKWGGQKERVGMFLLASCQQRREHTSNKIAY